jgi:hypothetical protein
MAKAREGSTMQGLQSIEPGGNYRQTYFRDVRFDIRKSEGFTENTVARYDFSESA